MRRLKHLLEFLLIVAVTLSAAYSALCIFKSSSIPLKYEESVKKYAGQYGVPPSVVYAVIKSESGFRPDAVSSAGAKGLMQIMPDTFSWLCANSGTEL